MRKIITSFVLALLTTVANAQYYGVGSSTSSTDPWGTTTTVHKDAYGNRTGTSTSSTDPWGTTTTTHKDAYGNRIGLPQAVPIHGEIPRRPIKMLMVIVQVLLPVAPTHGVTPIPPIRTVMATVQALPLAVQTHGETPPQPIETPMATEQALLRATQTHGVIVIPSSVATIPIQVSGPGKHE